MNLSIVTFAHFLTQVEWHRLRTINMLRRVISVMYLEQLLLLLLLLLFLSPIQIHPLHVLLHPIHFFYLNHSFLLQLRLESAFHQFLLSQFSFYNNKWICKKKKNVILLFQFLSFFLLLQLLQPNLRLTILVTVL